MSSKFNIHKITHLIKINFLSLYKYLKRSYKKILKNLLVVVLLLIIVTVIATSSMLIIGKKSIHNNQDDLVQGSNLCGQSVDQIIMENGKEYVYKKGLINILLLGIDTVDPMSIEVKPGDLGQSDAIYLLSIDTINDKINVIGIPRDTMVPIQINDSSNNYYNMETLQITLQYAYGNTCENGAKLTSKAVSTLLYNLPIQRTCTFNMKTISLVNDAIGGVQVTVEDDFTDETGKVVDAQFIKGNTITLKGRQAINFVRERDCNVFASSMDRVSRQEQYIDSFILTAKKSIKSDLILPIKIINEIKKNDYMYTDLNFNEMVYLTAEALKTNISSDNIITIPGEVRKGDQYEEYYADNEKIKDIILDKFYYQIN